MTRKPLLCSFLFAAAAVALPLAAQTTPAASTHRPATATSAHRSAAGCVTLPPLSPKIPALPTSAPCPRTLYTVTRLPDMKLDYASPLVSEPVREELGSGASTFSLNYVETKVGDGDLVQPHKCLAVQYTGYLANGTKFDSSHDRPGNQPIEFLYGAHQVIPGWDTGFEGMHMGGERRLIIPYELAYGENGRGPIPPKAELIFDVQAVSQSNPREGVPPQQECMKTPPGPAVMPHQPESPPAGAAPKGATTPPSGSAPVPPPSNPQGSAAPKPQRQE